MILSPAQIAQYAYKAGFRGDALNVAVAVALAESGGNTNAYNPEAAAGTRPGSGSRGLWQIYGTAHPEYNNDSAFDPAINAQAAFKVYREAGNRFTPWSTFNQGMARPTQNWASQAGNGLTQVAQKLTGQKNKNTVTTTTRTPGLAGQLQGSLQTAQASAGATESPATIADAAVNALTGGRSAYDLLFIGIGSALILIALIALLFGGYAAANVATGKAILKNGGEIAKVAAL